MGRKSFPKFRPLPILLALKIRKYLPRDESVDGFSLNFGLIATGWYSSTCFRVLSLTYDLRKFFTFVMTLNLVGILLAALNVWMYARKYTGVFVLGNLFTAILIRNELFGRILYLIVNTLFAKVGRGSNMVWEINMNTFSVASSVVPTWLYLCPSTPGRNSLRLCDIWLLLAYFQGLPQLHPASVKSRCNTGVRYANQSHRRSIRCLCLSLDPRLPSQVSRHH